MFRTRKQYAHGLVQPGKSGHLHNQDTLARSAGVRIIQVPLYNKIVCTVLFSSRWWVCWYELLSVLRKLQKWQIFDKKYNKGIFSMILGNYNNNEILELAVDTEWKDAINFVAADELHVFICRNIQWPTNTPQLWLFICLPVFIIKYACVAVLGALFKCKNLWLKLNFWKWLKAALKHFW